MNTLPDTLIQQLLTTGSASEAQRTLLAAGYTVSRNTLEARRRKLVDAGIATAIPASFSAARSTNIADPALGAARGSHKLFLALLDNNLANLDRMAEFQAREQGHKAGKSATPFTDNPYPEPALATAWARGHGDTPQVDA